MAMDLKICPSTYLTLNTEELKNAIRKSPKLLRTVQTGNHPIILPTDYKQQIPEYNKIEVNTLLERAKKIQRSSDLKEKIENILVNEVNDKRGRSFLNARLEEPEERLHEAYNSPSEADILTLNEFDSSKDWSKRYEIAQNLNDSRLRDLAFRLINEESPESLSPEINKRIDEEIKERLLGDIGSEWVTIKRAEESVTNHSSSKNSEREQEIIKSYKKFVEELKAKLNG
jgi:exodeoxyribonuclease-1